MTLVRLPVSPAEAPELERKPGRQLQSVPVLERLLVRVPVE